MLAYILKRLLLMIPTLFGVMLLTFVVIQFVPGGPVEQYMAEARAAKAGGAEGAGFGFEYRGDKGVDAKRLAEIKAQMPALPRELYLKFQQVYGLSAYDATILTETKEMAGYFESVCQHTTHYKAAANWLTNTIQSYLNEKNLDLDEFVVSPERLAALLSLIEQNKVSNSTASQKLFPLMIANPHHSPEQLAEANNLIQQSNTDLLQTLISEVLASNLPKVTEYKRGKKGLLGMFVGEVMKKSKGTADPKLTNQLVMKALEEA